MFANQVKDAVPVKFSSGPVDHVHNIGAVEPFAPGDENLRCNQFLGGQHLGMDSADLGVAGALDPLRLDAERAIAHAGDEVHEIGAAMDLAEPHRVADLGLIAMLRKRGKGRIHPIVGEEDIQVFGVAPDSGVLVERKGPADGKWNALRTEKMQHLSEHGSLLRCKIRRRGAADWQRFLVLGHGR